MRGDGQGCEQTTQGQGTGITHENRCGVRVVPQEAEAGDGRAYGDDGQIERIGHGIGISAMAAALDVVAFPECDDAKTSEGDHRRTCRQTVKSIRQIHCVGPCGHQEVHPDDEQDDGYGTAGEVEVEERLFDEADARLRTGESRFGGNQQRKYRVDGGEDELADELAAHR